MHHDIQKLTSYHNFYLFFPICKWKEFKLFQLLESFKKTCANAPSIYKEPVLILPIKGTFWPVCIFFFRWQWNTSLCTCIATCLLIPLWDFGEILLPSLKFNTPWLISSLKKHSNFYENFDCIWFDHKMVWPQDHSTTMFNLGWSPNRRLKTFQNLKMFKMSKLDF